MIKRTVPALVAASTMLVASAAMAAPGVRTSHSARSGAADVVKVGVVKSGHGEDRKAGRASRGDVTVAAPTTRVEKRRDRVVVDAPYTFVERSRHGVRVTAPFVDIYIPRR